jgi:hypothetical protein
MTYEQAYTKLLNHGNLIASEAGDTADQESFLFALSDAMTEESLPMLTHLSEDLLSCLEVVNQHVNGETPSEIIGGENQAIDRALVNAMSYIIHRGWEHYRRWERNDAFQQQARDHLALTLWRISSAWGAVLDGDIDSLAEHLRNEERALW